MNFLFLFCLTGYCWCAHDETGKPIPGTSVQNSKPNCDNLPLQVLNRPTPPPPKEEPKPVYHPLTAEAGKNFTFTSIIEQLFTS
jgi:hypothetical protein